MLFKKHSNLILIISLILLMLLVFYTSAKLANFKYNNFMYGKFDLGNMSQVVWNTKHGNFIMVTDQFGNDISRFGMSHVDLILVLLTPLYFIKEDPRMLIFFQQFIVISGAVATYLLAGQVLKSKNLAFLWGVAFLVYPAVGHILTKQTFHGVSLSAVFFLFSIYLYLKNQTLKNKYINLLFWGLIILTLLGKEEVPLVVAFFGIWIIYKFKDLKQGLALLTVGIVWFVIAFFILIPKYEDQRSIEFDNFIQSAEITQVNSSVFFKSNFFLHRYSQLGDSYFQIGESLILHPFKSLALSISTEDKQALIYLLAPQLFLSVISLPILLITLPELAINILSNQNIFAVDNHRVSMLIPIVFLASLFALTKFNRKLQYLLTFLVIFFSIYFSFKTNNLLLIEISKKFNVNSVFARDLINNEYQNAKNDPACINQILRLIPATVSYTGPNYMGAQTSMRVTNAVYPMRFYDADYLAIDLNEFSVHANEIGINKQMQDSVTAKVFSSDEYKIVDQCKSLFLFKRL